MHSEAALAQKLTRLARESKGQEQFIAAFAHELRNMMAPLDTALEVLELGRDDPLVVDRALPVARRQVRRLCHLVDDLVDAGRPADNAGAEPGTTYSVPMPEAPPA